MESEEELGSDIITNLPLNVIECILVRLPIREAIRTSILSRKWRYRWTTIPELVFDEKCISISSNNQAIIRNRVINFVDRVLLLHNGPIQKFKLSIPYLHSCPDIDQWILYLSRQDVKEFSLRLEDSEWYKVPSSLFSCQQLTHLELFHCDLQPPPTFKGFSNLKCLSLLPSFSGSDIIESLISSCPLLEQFTLTYCDTSCIQISAPNLKYLRLDGEFKDIYIKNTPLLSSLSIAMYTDEIAEHLEETTNCNLMGVLGSLPLLERLVAESYFVKYLSVGMLPRKKLPTTYNHLKNLELFPVCFEDVNEIEVVLYLISCSPSLEELQISASSDVEAGEEFFDLDFWEMQHSSDCSSRKLKTVKLIDISGVKNELEFIKFVLAKSPVLKAMSINPSIYAKEGGWDMLIELLQFPRASSQAGITYIIHD